MGNEAAISRARANAPRWAWLAGTFFGAGLLKPAPGTWGALAAVVIWVSVASGIPAAWHTAAALIAVAITTAVGIPAATRVAEATGAEDPGFVVIDEVAGQFLAFVAVPLGWKTIGAAFILFRAFDIWKPPPLRSLERLPGGTGIMLDDIGAGIYALIVMQVLLYFRVLG